VHDHATECSLLLDAGESGSKKGRPLFGHGHIELVMLKAAVTEEVIAH
jgi:hypothetical protein